MDYEKKYKSLVEAVKTLKEANQSDEGIQNLVKDNVPELKESEDEKIRKEMINFMSGQLGEQKPTNKVEPKFHEGEWITVKE